MMGVELGERVGKLGLGDWAKQKDTKIHIWQKYDFRSLRLSVLLGGKLPQKLSHILILFGTCNNRPGTDFIQNSLKKPEALVVWGIWHEVDGGVTSVIVGNAQAA